MLLNAVEAAYRRQFSFLMPGRSVIAEAVSVELTAASVGVAALVLPARRPRLPLLNAAGALFAAGTLLFSGTLYIEAITGSAPLPMAAPIGGTLLIVGWLALAVTALVRES